MRKQIALARRTSKWVVCALALGIVWGGGGTASGVSVPPTNLNLGPVGVVQGNWIGVNVTNLGPNPQRAITAVYNGDGNLLKQKQVMVNPGQTTTLGFLAQVYLDVRARITVPGGTEAWWLPDLLVLDGVGGPTQLAVDPSDPTGNTVYVASPIAHVVPEGALRVHVANLGTSPASVDVNEYDAAGNLVAQMAIANVTPGTTGTASFPGGVTGERRITVTGPGGSQIAAGILASPEYYIVASGRTAITLKDVLVSS